MKLSRSCLCFLPLSLETYKAASRFTHQSVSQLSLRVAQEQLLFGVCLSAPHGMQDLSSPTKDQTCAPSGGSRVLTAGPPGKSQEQLLNIWQPWPSSATLYPRSEPVTAALKDQRLYLIYFFTNLESCS